MTNGRSVSVLIEVNKRPVNTIPDRCWCSKGKSCKLFRREYGLAFEEESVVVGKKLV